MLMHRSPRSVRPCLSFVICHLSFVIRHLSLCWPCKCSATILTQDWVGTTGDWDNAQFRENKRTSITVFTMELWFALVMYGLLSLAVYDLRVRYTADPSV